MNNRAVTSRSSHFNAQKLQLLNPLCSSCTSACQPVPAFAFAPIPVRAPAHARPHAHADACHHLDLHVNKTCDGFPNHVASVCCIEAVHHCGKLEAPRGVGVSLLLLSYIPYAFPMLASWANAYADLTSACPRLQLDAATTDGDSGAARHAIRVSGPASSHVHCAGRLS